LPFADGAFETLIAYNSLQTMGAAGDLSAAVLEASRVLNHGGHFCFCVAHPMTDVALVGGLAANDDGSISGSYFENHRVEETVTQRGLTMTFHGWTYALEDYTRALAEAGFTIEMLREPVPSAGQVAERPSLERWRRMPLFLFVRARKQGTA
jgi:hypothetical protein